jgi:hypothetical protein
MFEETSRLSQNIAEAWDAEECGNQNAASPASGPAADASRQRIYLPRGSAETRFAPRQYYYLASEGGVVPRWAIESQTRASPPQ